jgi:catechol 2,3-dioxygenase-like lactoylglutathione lyase family enzyme
MLREYNKLEGAAPRIESVHHLAFRCRDAEETRRFYEDVLGLELSAALAFDEVSGTAATERYMHLFFRMADGNFVAFFDAPDHIDDPKLFDRKWGFDQHFAMAVGSRDDLLAFQQRIKAAGVTCLGPLDHHFCQSIYFYDPNGVQVELTWRMPEHDRIMDDEKKTAREQIRAWSEETLARKAAKLKPAARPAPA